MATPHKPICVASLCLLLGCGGQPTDISDARSHQESNLPPAAPSAASMSGFDGARAFEHVRHLVEFGPRPPASDAIRKAQSYIAEQLKSYGCRVEEHDFHASTPLGDLPMKNIVAKIPGIGPGIVLFATHYDTVRLPL